jgi:phosphoribosylformimino-5-aminoimidazole carboxamide ribotide isomerase
LVISPNSDCVNSMELILAVDLRDGLVVHGVKGERSTYAPLNWGIASSADPIDYLCELAPRFIYIADLDRIEGRGNHDDTIRACAGMVERCYVDRGSRSPSDILGNGSILNVIGTETGGTDLSRYEKGFLSIDIREGRVIPNGEDPLALLKKAEHWSFEGCIILNLGSVGTGEGLIAEELEAMRATFSRTLLYGGGIAGEDDLGRLADTGFDGAIVATAIHRGAIPLEWIRRGQWC